MPKTSPVPVRENKAEADGRQRALGASGVQAWYIVGVYPHELFLTKDPITTSRATTTFNVTLTR